MQRSECTPFVAYDGVSKLRAVEFDAVYSNTEVQPEVMTFIFQKDNRVHSTRSSEKTMIIA